MPLSSNSSLSLSIYLFLWLPLYLSPLTCPCSAAFGSLFPSSLSTCPNHVSLLLLIFSITVSSAPSSSLFYSFLILSLLLLPLIFLNHEISATSSLLSSSFLSIQHSDPYINTGSTSAQYFRKHLKTKAPYFSVKTLSRVGSAFDIGGGEALYKRLITITITVGAG